MFPHGNQRRKIFTTVAAILLGMLAAEPSLAFTKDDKFPKISNYYLRSGTDITENTIPLLARYDLLILPAEAQIQNPNLFGELRRQNPSIVILAYVPTISFNNRFWSDSLHQKLLQGIKSDWWLRDSRGNTVSIWPGTQALNLKSDWADYLPRFVHNEILAGGKWDGVFYDEVGDCVSCYNQGDIDLDGNNARDISSIADNAWRNGYKNIFSTSRALEQAGRLIVINGSSDPIFQPYINGRLFESFPTPWEGSGKWQDSMQNYQKLELNIVNKPLSMIIGGDTGNTGKYNNYQNVRFGLTSALLGGGFFGYDFGTTDHGQLLWYDEYDTFLGRPISAPRDLLRPTNISFSPSVWRRDFEKGVVLVNSTSAEQTISLREDFEKLHGVEDPLTNDGSIISKLTIMPNDGVVLMRLNDRIVGAGFPNGAFSRIFNDKGQTTRTGFFSYDARITGGNSVIAADIDGNGTMEAVTENRGKIEIINEDGSKRLSFAPYGSFKGKINIAIASAGKNGQYRIITGAGAGGGPHVRIFNINGQPLGGGFFAYDKNSRGGVQVAAADIDGDGEDEIITGAGKGSRPEVKVFKAGGLVLNNGFLAYSLNFRGGVNVAAGDITGDGKALIVTGAGAGGGPHVRIFDWKGALVNNGFFPYDSSLRTGVMVGVADLNGDGKAEILAFSELP